MMSCKKDYVILTRQLVWGRMAACGRLTIGLQDAILPHMRELILLAVALQPAIGMQDIAAGNKLYAAHCAACHGPNGAGGRGPRLPAVARAPESPVRVRQA